MIKPAGIETEFKKRLYFPYLGYRKQNDAWARMSSFIYKIADWERLNEEIALRVSSEELDKTEYFQYCINGRYNFWRARATEYIFTSIHGVKPVANPKKKLVDFNFFGIDFD